MKKIGRKAILCLLIASVFVMPISAVKNNETNILKADENYGFSTSLSNGGIFIQLPAPPDPSGWITNSYSDVENGWICYEDFWDISVPICDIHWWGFSVFFDGSSLVDVDPTGTTFDITFYEDDDLYPGEIVCQYSDIIPDSITTTGIINVCTSGDITMYYFGYNLDPCCELSNGWVSILKKDSPNECVFSWAGSIDGNGRYRQFWEEINDWYSTGFKDLSLVLTDGVSAEPDLECEGSISWTDVEPGASVNASFTVANNGDATSILHWNIESYPDWGVNWTCVPNGNVQTPDMGGVTVKVEVIAPEEGNTEFTGELKLVNAENPDDFCTIGVSLATPKNSVSIDTPFLRFLQQHPIMFPVLRYLLGL